MAPPIDVPKYECWMCNRVQRAVDFVGDSGICFDCAEVQAEHYQLALQTVEQERGE